MRTMRMMSLFLVLVLAGGAVAADRTVTTTPVTGPVQTIGSATLVDPCTFGNAVPAAFAINNWIWGAESYATIFHADPVSCTCSGGFMVQAVHFYMNFRAADVPSTFAASADFRETVLDPAYGCNVPGQAICTSPLYTITITQAGLYDITIPMDVAGCTCAYFGYDYAVSINFPTAFPATKRPDAVTDAVPLGCTSWNDYGSGWTDTTADAAFPGELVMFADVACCESPVGVDGKSWGEMKSLYR